MGQEIKKLQEILEDSRKVVIIPHSNPDGDAIGSCLGLYHFLKQLDKEATVIAPTNYPNFLQWMPGNDTVLVYQKDEKLAKDLIQNTDVIFCLDFNAPKRAGDLATPIVESPAKKVMIDHHPEPESFVDVMISIVQSSSTSELVYDLIQELRREDFINKDIADCLYAGILSDTGAFQYPITTAKVHRITADLIQRGADNSGIYQRLYNSFSESRLRLFGYCITEKLKIYPEMKAAMISLDSEELKRFNVKSGDTEGLVNFPLKIEDIKFATLIIDRTERIKMSFRSKGEFNVNAFARKYFNGGGHKNAAGGQSTETLEQTVKKFEEVLPEFKNELNP